MPDSSLLLILLGLVAIFVLAGVILRLHLVLRSCAAEDSNGDLEGASRLSASIHVPFEVAVLVVLFAVTTMLLIPWALSSAALGSEGVVKILVYLVAVLVAYIYMRSRGERDD